MKTVDELMALADAYADYIGAEYCGGDSYDSDQARSVLLSALQEVVQQVAQPLTLEQIVSIVEAIDDTPGMSHIRVLELLTRAIERAHNIGARLEGGV